MMMWEDGHALRESGKSMHFESAVDGHDTNYDQRQQQVGRSAPHHHYVFHQNQKRQLEGETSTAGSSSSSA
jgi:hypothetical protein